MDTYKETMEYVFRKATAADIDSSMKILEFARQQMLSEGKKQWDANYPTRANVEADVHNCNAYVMQHGDRLVAYGAVVFTGEPAYCDIDGHWLSEQPFVVLHRIAVAGDERGHGIGVKFMQEVERLAISKDVHSFRADTNYDNERMQRLFEKMGFTYCGKISYPQGQRMAYEKLLV